MSLDTSSKAKLIRYRFSILSIDSTGILHTIPYNGMVLSLKRTKTRDDI